MTEKTQFALTGFRQHGEFRVFTFQNADARRERTEYTVRANTTLVRKYAIPLQELPLLCRALLDRLFDAEKPGVITFTEADMAAHATTAANTKREAALRKTSRPKPTTAHLGAAWRTGSLPAKTFPSAAEAWPPKKATTSTGA